MGDALQVALLVVRAEVPTPLVGADTQVLIRGAKDGQDRDLNLRAVKDRVRVGLGSWVQDEAAVVIDGVGEGFGVSANEQNI